MQKYIEKYYGMTKEIQCVVIRRKLMLFLFKNDGYYRKKLIELFPDEKYFNVTYQLDHFLKNGVITEEYFDDEKKDISLKLTEYGVYLYCVFFFNKRMKDIILLLGANGNLNADQLSEKICVLSAESVKKIQSSFEFYCRRASKKIKKNCGTMVKRNALILNSDCTYSLNSNGLTMYNAIKDKLKISGIKINESFK